MDLLFFFIGLMLLFVTIQAAINYSEATRYLRKNNELLAELIFVVREMKNDMKKDDMEELNDQRE